MRRAPALIVAVLALTAAALLSAPVAGSADSPELGFPSSTTVQTTKTCSWEWKKKRVFRWVWRQGKRKRVVKLRRVKVRVCREVPVPAPARLGVKAWEFGFTLSATTVAAGDTIIELNNQGEDDHDLHIQRVDGGEELATPETGPGQVNRIRLTTTPGEYRLWCSLPTHAQRGMDTTFEAG